MKRQKAEARMKRNLWITFLVVWLVILMYGCGGGSGCDGCTGSEKNGSPRIEGDSMAAAIEYVVSTGTVSTIYDWRSDYPNAQPRGVSGATLSAIYANLDTRPTGTIILFAGFNNIKKLGQSEDYIINLYAQILGRLPGVFYCVGVPPMDHSKSDLWYAEGKAIPNDRILSIDNRIHQICGENYIDTPSFWTPDDTNDGIHLNDRGYRKVIDALKAKGVKP